MMGKPKRHSVTRKTKLNQRNRPALMVTWAVNIVAAVTFKIRLTN